MVNYGEVVITGYLMKFGHVVNGQAICLSINTIFEANRRFLKAIQNNTPIPFAINSAVRECLVENNYSEQNADRIKNYLDKLSVKNPVRYSGLFNIKTPTLCLPHIVQDVCQAIH